MKILVTGGCGYIGTALIPKLLDAGHKVLSVDKQLFGNFLLKHKNLENIKMNIGNIKETNINNIDTVIHLASISNDPAALSTMRRVKLVLSCFLFILQPIHDYLSFIST